MSEKKKIEFTEDPNGFFYIYVKDELIHVEHYENTYKQVNGVKTLATGKINKTFTGTRADDLYREILAQNLVSRLDHAAYLGAELAKAQISLQQNIEYEQDE